MKNKIIRLLPILFTGLSCLSLGSCNNGNGGGSSSFEKVRIDYGTYRSEPLTSITSLPELTYDELTSKATVHKDSFLLAIYNETCICWQDFAPVLTEFINDTGCNVDYINVNKFINKDNDFGLYLVKGDLPSIAIFRNGKLAVQSVFLRDDRMIFKQYKNHFENFIKENVILPKMYYIERNDVDKFIAEDKEFNLYCARSECGDCTTLDDNILIPWSRSIDSAKEKLYIFDMQQYWALDPAWYPAVYGREATAEEIQKFNDYVAIKNEYGMSEGENNPNFGYGTGAFPTLQRRKGNQIKDMCVVLNDEVDKDNKVIKSYFTEERVNKMAYLTNATCTKVLNGMSLTDDQIANWSVRDHPELSYKTTYCSTYHYPIVKEFINYYIA